MHDSDWVFGVPTHPVMPANLKNWRLVCKTFNRIAFFLPWPVELLQMKNMREWVHCLAIKNRLFSEKINRTCFNVPKLQFYVSIIFVCHTLPGSHPTHQLVHSTQVSRC